MKKGMIVAIFLCCIACQEKGKSSATNNAKSLKKQRWRLVSSYPKSLTSFWEISDYFTKNVKLLSDNSLRIRAYQPGELVPALGVFDAVSSGSVAMGITTGYFYSGKNKALILDTGEPFGMTSKQKNAWLYEAGGLELLQEIYKKYNIMYFPFGNTGIQMGGWFRTEIKTENDLKGLRMRVPGIGGMVYDKLGATVQVLGAGEIFPSLEQGVLDAAEFVGPYDDEKLGFQKIAKYYYAPGWQETGSTVALYINLDKWKTLPLKTQKIIEVLSKNCNLLHEAKYNVRNSISYEDLKKQGIIFKTFDKKILQDAQKKTKEILKSYMADPDFAKIYSSIRAFQKKSNDWFYQNEYKYLEFKNENR